MSLNGTKKSRIKQTTPSSVFDVCEFYPSITEDLLKKALEFASQYDIITKQESDIILQAKKSLLFNKETPWCKRNTKSQFDVTMGSFDGAETCELIGLFILSELKPKYGSCVGLYRDDGLAAFNETPKKIEQIKKDICKTFEKHNLKITIDANKKVVDYLDITLDLSAGIFKPYMKPNNTPIFLICNNLFCYEWLLNLTRCVLIIHIIFLTE